MFSDPDSDAAFWAFHRNAMLAHLLHNSPDPQATRDFVGIDTRLRQRFAVFVGREVAASTPWRFAEDASGRPGAIFEMEREGFLLLNPPNATKN